MYVLSRVGDISGEFNSKARLRYECVRTHAHVFSTNIHPRSALRESPQDRKTLAGEANSTAS